MNIGLSKAKVKAKRKSLLIKIFIILLLNVVAVSTFIYYYNPPATYTLSKVGSRGAEVKAIQTVLKDHGLYKGAIDGIYGPQTKAAVIKFQKSRNLTPDGIAGPATLKKMGISIGSAPAATQSNINLLARIISAEGRGEVYIGMVAIGGVILNRIEHPSFPDTLSGVIYQPGAFTAITDGQFNQPVEDICYKAAKDALNGWDPSGGAIYYYNPRKTNNQWIRQRPVIKTIGFHVFCA